MYKRGPLDTASTAPAIPPTVTQMDATPIANPGQPLWQSHPPWRDNRMRSDAKAGLGMIRLFAVVFLGVGGFLATIIPAGLEKGNTAVLFARAFPLAGLGMTISAVHKTLEWRRFGPLALIMDPFPGSLGGDVGGTIELRETYDPNFEFKVTLALSRVYVTVSGENRSTRTDVIWDQAGIATATRTRPRSACGSARARARPRSSVWSCAARPARRSSSPTG